MNLSKSPVDARPDTESSLVEWFLDDFWPRFGKQTLIGLGVVLVLGAGWYWFDNSREAQQAAENKELGAAYLYIGQEKNDSAVAFLQGFLKKTHSRLVQDKANVLLGTLLYNQGKYDEAIKAYEAVDLTNTKQPLLSSGALHGLAASHIQKKDYAKAAPLLETFVSRFGRRTGAPAERVEGNEVADLSPAVPNALWKLALVYRELKDDAKAKAAVEKLLRIYPDAKESFEATRLQAQLP